MGLIKAILALFKAFPALERFFVQVSNAVREANAAQRYEDKLTHIDNAMRNARRLRDDEGIGWSEDPDRSPPVPEGRTTSTSVYERCLEDGGSTRV